MRLFKKHPAAIGFLLTSILFIGCNYTVTKTKHAVFSVDESIVQTNLNKLVTCENINLAGKEVTSNSKTTSELEVDIMNGQNIPADTEQMNTLAKSIAVELKKSLKDPNEYDKINVLFVRKWYDGAATRKEWKGHEFKSAEL